MPHCHEESQLKGESPKKKERMTERTQLSAFGSGFRAARNIGISFEKDLSSLILKSQMAKVILWTGVVRRPYRHSFPRPHLERTRGLVVENWFVLGEAKPGRYFAHHPSRLSVERVSVSL